ncbi:hypothetical protein GJA_38 [Janthinobacterium agaricidamnosum NBRC 102515 = DSM 9628]|uniref:Uncharacterized protein n=1 Tax=Janthinobacterium agaricidamnosum NBRC 102515 = DSM 9628 TaxID=1349767 RepID=W0UYI5_9BURK|nr:hypothetical protein GJA_38 [Janthinobacterium agaricidamnosum NBRC 102515 = DSM 9628]
MSRHYIFFHNARRPRQPRDDSQASIVCITLLVFTFRVARCINGHPMNNAFLAITFWNQ